MNTIHWAAAHDYWMVSIVVLGIVGLLVYRLSRIRSVMHVLAGIQVSFLLVNCSYMRQVLKVLLMTLSVSLLFLALLRPQWGKSEQVMMQEGRDIFIALDISRSMLATDCEPNRLFCAKKKIKTLLSKLSCERVGLIVFSGSALVQCPLTKDYQAFLMFLDSVDVETISSGTTALDQAIKQALDAFAQLPSRKSKLLVIATDGEDFSSNLNKYKKEAECAGLHIFTLGIGTQQGAPIPLFDEHGVLSDHQKDAHGNVVISRLNEGILRTLAADAGGTYVSLSTDEHDVHTIVESVQRFEREKIEDIQVQEGDDKYPYFACAGLVCLLLEWLL